MEESYTSFVGKIIILEANIAVGKSTLGKSICRLLAKKGLSVFFFPEQIPSELFKLYTKNSDYMKRYAFPFQVIVARDRKQILKESIRMAKQGKTIVIDRGLLGDYAFANMQKKAGFFTEEEFKAYLDMVRPDLGNDDMSILHIFLDCKPEEAYRRMVKRAIVEETKAYDLSYFQKLDESHREVMHGSVISVDWNSVSVIEDGFISDEVCERFLNTIFGS